MKKFFVFIFLFFVIATIQGCAKDASAITTPTYIISAGETTGVTLTPTVETSKVIFSTWKTVTVSAKINTVDSLRTELKNQGYGIDDLTDNVLNKIILSVNETPREINLVRVSKEDLGFNSDATGSEIFNKALELGLELCPAEVGLKLALEYTDQPNAETVVIGMQSVIGPDTMPIPLLLAFGRFTNGEKYLTCANGGLNYIWEAWKHEYFVFVLHGAPR